MNLEDRLDGALAGDMVAFAASPEVAGLVDTGDEVERSARDLDRGSRNASADL